MTDMEAKAREVRGIMLNCGSEELSLQTLEKALTEAKGDGEGGAFSYRSIFNKGLEEAAKVIENWHTDWVPRMDAATAIRENIKE